VSDLRLVADALIPPAHPPGPLVPVHAGGPKKIEHPREIIDLEPHEGETWVERIGGQREVMIRGVFEDRVLLFGNGRKSSCRRDTFRARYKKKDCPDPRLDKVLERLNPGGLPSSPLEWSGDVGPSQ
jgi:hypothetical protein